VSTSVVTRVTVLYKLVSRPDPSAIPNLHNRSEIFHDRAVRVADTKIFAEVLAECAVGHKVIVLILVANILLLLAFEQSSEPTEDAVGRLGLIVSLLELSVRVWDAGKSKGAKKREAQGHCNEGLHGEALQASEWKLKSEVKSSKV
jgi:hypothetical protein